MFSRLGTFIWETATRTSLWLFGKRSCSQDLLLKPLAMSVALNIIAGDPLPISFSWRLFFYFSRPLDPEPVGPLYRVHGQGS